MTFRVVKPFKSINRKFAEGDAVTAADIDPTSVFSLADWIARGFVKDDVEASAPAASKGFFAKATADAE